MCYRYLHSFAQRVLGGGIHESLVTAGVTAELPEGLLGDLEDSEILQVFTVIASNPFSWGTTDIPVNSHVSTDGVPTFLSITIQVLKEHRHSCQ